MMTINLLNVDSIAEEKRANAASFLCAIAGQITGAIIAALYIIIVG